MTDIDALRDRLAVLCGWERFTHPIQGEFWSPGLNSSKVVTHPFRANDYNALVEVWPEGWEWERDYDYDDGVRWWAAFPKGWDGEAYPTVPDTGDEYADRLRLTVAVLEATKKTKETT